MVNINKSECYLTHSGFISKIVDTSKHTDVELYDLDKVLVTIDESGNAIFTIITNTGKYTTRSRKLKFYQRLVRFIVGDSLYSSKIKEKIVNEYSSINKLRLEYEISKIGNSSIRKYLVDNRYLNYKDKLYILNRYYNTAIT